MTLAECAETARSTRPSIFVSSPPESVRRALAEGDRIDHFTIERELGRGAMGVVYLAHDRALDRRVALKVISVEKEKDVALDRFLREARAQAKLDSPHVVAIHFIGRAGAAAYFAMEYVDGEMLESLLERGERLDAERARLLMLEVALGLSNAYAAGFIHRDIKPSNLLVDRAGHAKIADFGLAKPLSNPGALTGKGVVLGTPMYMAPEQTRGETIDHRADMYALGCTFYHLLAGEPPYDGKGLVELLTKHFVAPVPSVVAKAPDVPPALGAILERLMQKDPAARFGSYDELIAALEAAAPRVIEPAGIAVRVAATAFDVALCLFAFALVSPLGTVAQALGMALVLALVVALEARTGQSPGKYLFRVRTETLDGGRLGILRVVGRFAVAAWLPICVAAILLLKGRHDVLAAAPASGIGSWRAVVSAFAVGNGAISVLYGACLGLAAIHPEKHALHDLLVRSRVVHVTQSRRS